MSADGNIIVYQTTGNVIKVLERRNKIFKEVQDLGSGTKPAVSADGSLIGFISGTDFKIYK